MAHGPDPYLYCKKIDQEFDYEKINALMFEYRSREGLDRCEIYYGPPIDGQHTAKAKVKPATDWTWFILDIKSKGKNWDRSFKQIRLD